MLKTPSLTPSEAAQVVADSEKAGAAEASKPAWNDVYDRYPALQGTARTEENGQVTLDYLADCHNPEQRTRRMYEVEEMFGTFHRKDIELGQEKQGRMEMVRVKDHLGIREIPIEYEDARGRKTGARRCRTSQASLYGFLTFLSVGGQKWGQDRQGRWWKRLHGEWAIDSEGPPKRSLD